MFSKQKHPKHWTWLALKPYIFFFKCSLAPWKYRNFSQNNRSLCPTTKSSQDHCTAYTTIAMKKTYQDVLARHRKSKLNFWSSNSKACVVAAAMFALALSGLVGFTVSIPRGQRTLLLREKRLWQYYRGLIQLQNDPEGIWFFKLFCVFFNI